LTTGDNTAVSEKSRTQWANTKAIAQGQIVSGSFAFPEDHPPNGIVQDCHHGTNKDGARHRVEGMTKIAITIFPLMILTSCGANW
jgi:hypothetical protein